MPTSSLLFLGESPPTGEPPISHTFAAPTWVRLATLVGLRDAARLPQVAALADVFPTPHGCPDAPPWPASATASKAAHGVVMHHAARGRQVVVCLGRRVARALHDGEPPTMVPWLDWGLRFLPIMHPASALAHTPNIRAEIRRALLPELILGCPDLQAEDLAADALGDWAHALAPTRPVAGLAVLEHLRGQLRLQVARRASTLLQRIADVEPPPPPMSLYQIACILLTEGHRPTSAGNLLGIKHFPSKVKSAASRLVVTSTSDGARATHSLYHGRMHGAP